MANIGVFSQFLKEPPSAMDYADKFAASDQAQQQNALSRLMMQEKTQAMGEQNRLRQLYQQNPNATPDQLRGAGFRDEASKAEGAALERRKTDSEIGYKEAQTGKAKVEAAAKTAEMNYEKIARHAQEVAAVQTMDDVVAYVDRGIANGVPGFTPEVRQQALDRASGLGIDAWKQAATQGAIPVLERFKEDANLKRAELQAQTSIATNAATNETSRSNNAASNATSRANNSASVAQQERSSVRSDARTRESNENTRGKPFEVTGPEGTPILAQQDKQGNIKPVEGYSPKAPKEGVIPASANKSYIENRQSASDLDRAIKLVGGNKNAFGAANYIPGSQYFDQKGIQARAAVANVGSLLIHDRSGAAVTIAEMPRLAPFVPSATDRPETVDKKLRQLKEAIEQSGALMVEAYPALGKRGSAPGKSSGDSGGLTPAEQEELAALKKKLGR